MGTAAGRAGASITGAAVDGVTSTGAGGSRSATPRSTAFGLGAEGVATRSPQSGHGAGERGAGVSSSGAAGSSQQQQQFGGAEVSRATASPRNSVLTKQ